MARGKEFETEVRKGLESFQKQNPDFYFMRLFDARSFGGKLRQQQPADFLAIYQGVPIFLECKSSHSKTSFDMYQIKEGQWQKFKEVILSKAKVLLLINRRERKNNACYVITPSNLIQAVGLKQSLKWSEFENNIGKLPFNSVERCWEFQNLFSAIEPRQ
jgi:penicillin-binding protein-related factor A (putative recombinase)